MNISPNALQKQLTDISEESFKLHMELATLVERSAYTWLELKRSLEVAAKGKVTNAEVDKEFDNTEDGRRIAYLKIFLRGLSHKRTALILEAKANSGSFL